MTKNRLQVLPIAFAQLIPDHAYAAKELNFSDEDWNRFFIIAGGLFVISTLLQVLNFFKSKKTEYEVPFSWRFIPVNLFLSALFGMLINMGIAHDESPPLIFGGVLGALFLIVHPVANLALLSGKIKGLKNLSKKPRTKEEEAALIKSLDPLAKVARGLFGGLVFSLIFGGMFGIPWIAGIFGFALLFFGSTNSDQSIPYKKKGSIAKAFGQLGKKFKETASVKDPLIKTEPELSRPISIKLVLFELLAFAAVLLIARLLHFQITDLIWSIWFSSLTVGLAIIYWSFLKSSFVGVIKRPRGISFVTLLIGSLFSFAFFLIHFGAFHLAHAAFLNGLFPLELLSDGRQIYSFNQVPELIPLAIKRFGPLILLAFYNKRKLFLDPTIRISPFTAYKSVIKMHLMIFAFAILKGALKNEFHTNFFVFAFTYAVFYFPAGDLWRALFKRARAT
jgi:hypothetical protein